MASLGTDLFAPALLAPIVAARSHLAADHVDVALEEMSADKLRGALQAAAKAAADHVGVRPPRVLGLLPAAEIDAALAKIAASQPRAVEAWRRFAGGLGGLLGRATQAADAGGPSLSERLRALAGTMSRDKVVSEPLAAFAGDLAEWEALADRLPAIVGGSSELARALAIKKGKLTLLLAAIAAALIVAAIVTRAALAARSNVRAALAKPDACAAFEVTPVDLGRVSADLAGQVSAKRKACEDRRAEEARLAEEERRRQEAEEAARKAKMKREADCELLARHVEQGKLQTDDDAIAKDDGLTRRIADSALESKDFGPDDPKMPCAGTRAEPRLWESYRKAVIAKPWILLVATAPSPRAREAFRPDGGKMPFKLREVIATRANDLAKFAVRSGKTPDAERASAWCDVARSVGMPMAGPCDLADKLAKPK
ncbi:MAG: hypothetical protein U0441_11715 [Polyangiaceae bacterium]